MVIPVIPVIQKHAVSASAATKGGCLVPLPLDLEDRGDEALSSTLRGLPRAGPAHGRMEKGGRICLSMSSCGECDGPDRVLPGLIQLPARDGAYKSRCSVLDVMEASTRLINAVPPDVVLAACRALRMAAAAITYLLRSVDVGAQAPTPALGKMASWPSCAMRCAKIQVESTGPCSRCLVSQNH